MTTRLKIRDSRVSGTSGRDEAMVAFVCAKNEVLIVEDAMVAERLVGQKLQKLENWLGLGQAARCAQRGVKSDVPGPNGGGVEQLWRRSGTSPANRQRPSPFWSGCARLSGPSCIHFTHYE